MEPRSLHYMDPRQPNLYMRAIHAVGSVIQDYDRCGSCSSGMWFS